MKQHLDAMLKDLEIDFPDKTLNLLVDKCEAQSLVLRKRLACDFGGFSFRNKNSKMLPQFQVTDGLFAFLQAVQLKKINDEIYDDRQVTIIEDGSWLIGGGEGECRFSLERDKSGKWECRSVAGTVKFDSSELQVYSHHTLTQLTISNRVVGMSLKWRVVIYISQL